MKYVWTRFLVALWASFMVATVGPVIFNGLFAMTAPVTCPGGKIDVQTDVYNPRPGETDTTFTPSCTLPNGTTVEIPVLSTMGVIWAGSLLPFWLIMLVLPAGAFSWLNQNRRYGGQKTDYAAEFTGPDHATLGRLKELNQAYEQKLITREEYDTKRQEILKGM